jgi:hypothetical protein
VAARPKRTRADRSRRADFTRPVPSLARLLDALARRGAVRPACEPLERFADRLDGGELEGAAALLRRWAEHRYGGVGSEDGILRDMDACADRLARSPRARGR